MMKHFFLFITFLLNFFILEAQNNIAVIGNIIDVTTGEIIENVHVKVLQSVVDRVQKRIRTTEV